MNLRVALLTRDFANPLSPPDVTFRPERYGWTALGGPDFADVAVAGESRALWSMLNWLRAPLEIRDEQDRPVWWGYVDEVTVRTGALEIGVGLRQMANRVAVTYSYVAPGSNSVGTRATTTWAQDDDSVATYGTKELMSSRDGCSTEVAAARRDAILDRLAYPIPQVRMVGGGGKGGATLRCLGWWHALDWTHYSRSAGLESHSDGTASQAVGAASDNQRVAQSFQLTGGEAWDAAQIQVKLAAVGSPSDTVYVDLCPDSGGAPGSAAATGSVDGATLSTSANWVTFELGSEVALALATTYWIVIRRGGSVDSSDYYTAKVDEDLGYTSGVLRLYDGSTWSARGTDADLVFKARGVEETTTQIKAAIDAEGQFFSDVDLVDASGVRSNQYRDGDTTALYAVRALLEDGNSDGVRMLATVTRDRVLRVYDEPVSSDVTLYVGANGIPRTAWGSALLAHTCPVAQWCALRDVIPATVNTSVLAAPSPFFVERAEFDVDRQVWIPEPRGVPSPWEIGELVDG